MTAVKSTGRRSQEERSSASSAAMLDAAIELVVEHGSRASMMDIGRRCGFSTSLVLARFGSKAGLLSAVVREIRLRFRTEIDAALGNHQGLAALSAFLDVYFSALAKRSLACRAFFVIAGEALGPDPIIREAFASADGVFRERIGKWLDEAKARHEIGEKFPVPDVAGLVVSVLRGAGMQAHVNPEGFDLAAAREAAHYMLDSLVRASLTES